jgi:hypothetical protein
MEVQERAGRRRSVTPRVGRRRVAHRVTAASQTERNVQAAFARIEDPKLREAAEGIWPTFRAGVKYLEDR